MPGQATAVFSLPLEEAHAVPDPARYAAWDHLCIVKHLEKKYEMLTIISHVLEYAIAINVA